MDRSQAVRSGLTDQLVTKSPVLVSKKRMILERHSKLGEQRRSDEPSLWPGEEDLHRFVAIKFIEPGVLRFGFENGFLNASDVVRLELMRYVSGAVEVGSAEEAIALLLSDDLSRVSSLMDAAVNDSTRLSTSEPLDVWVYVGLARINSLWESFDDPWDAIEWLLQLLGYPESYKHFLRYTEAERGDPTGLQHMKTRLDQFLNLRQSDWGP